MINFSKIKTVCKNLYSLDYFNFNDEIKKEEAINHIRYLPELIMRDKYKILIDCPQDPIGQVFSGIKNQYQYHAAWMNYYQGDNTILFSLNPRIQDYKSIADLSEATLKLCQEISFYTSRMSEKSINPMHWFLSIEQQSCEDVLASSGLTGTPNLKGKNELYRESVAQDKFLEKTNSPRIEVELCSLKALDALEGLGTIIADNDIVFKNNQWLNYRRAVKRHYREMKNSHLNTVCLVDGQVKRIGRGRDSR
jgi:hypothetical protein